MDGRLDVSRERRRIGCERRTMTGKKDPVEPEQRQISLSGCHTEVLKLQLCSCGGGGGPKVSEFVSLCWQDRKVHVENNKPVMLRAVMKVEPVLEQTWSAC